MSFGLRTCGNSWLGNAQFRIEDSDLHKKVILVTLVKRGPVFDLLMNGKRLKMIRDAGFGNPTSIDCGYKRAHSGHSSNFEINKIAVYEL